MWVCLFCGSDNEDSLSVCDTCCKAKGWTPEETVEEPSSEFETSGSWTCAACGSPNSGSLDCCEVCSTSKSDSERILREREEAERVAREAALRREREESARRERERRERERRERAERERAEREREEREREVLEYARLEYEREREERERYEAEERRRRGFTDDAKEKLLMIMQFILPIVGLVLVGINYNAIPDYPWFGYLMGVLYVIACGITAYLAYQEFIASITLVNVLSGILMFLYVCVVNVVPKAFDVEYSNQWLHAIVGGALFIQLISASEYLVAEILLENKGIVARIVSSIGALCTLVLFFIFGEDILPFAFVGFLVSGIMSFVAIYYHYENGDENISTAITIVLGLICLALAVLTMLGYYTGTLYLTLTLEAEGNQYTTGILTGLLVVAVSLSMYLDEPLCYGLTRIILLVATIANIVLFMRADIYKTAFVCQTIIYAIYAIVLAIWSNIEAEGKKLPGFLAFVNIVFTIIAFFV